jgi:CRP/FNR family transcriptional regulator, cyclic AMP receptor protein
VPDLTDDLKRVPLFSELDRRQLKRLAEHFRERTVKSGTTPVREGEMSGVGFFVVADGRASVTADGRELATLGPGDYFGEIALITEAKRTATVTATTELRLLEIAFWDFREFAHANPDVMWKLLQTVVARLQQ